MRSRGVTAKDAAFLGIALAALACLHFSVLFRGRVYFLNDLIHVNQPWRVLTAEQLQEGRAPLWNPYSYLGLPLLGTMQTGPFYPLSMFFQIFTFGRALGLFLFANYALGAFWAYLWMRRWGFSRWACCASSCLFVLGGYAVAFLQNINLLATVLQLPGFFLFSGSVGLMALISATAFLAGYPPFWVGLTACLIVVRGFWPRVLADKEARSAKVRGELGRSAVGLLLGLALSCLVLAPGAELARLSNRQGGLSLGERLNNSMKPRELWAFIHPELARSLSLTAQGPRELIPQLEQQERQQVVWMHDGKRTTFTFYERYGDPMADPSGIKYPPDKSCYIGFVGFLLMLIGLTRLAWENPLRAIGLALAAVLAAAVLLGSSTAFSPRLWQTLPILHYFRGPGRLAFLPLAAILPLTALGFDTLSKRLGKARAILAAGMLIELLWTGWGYYPTAPAPYYHQTGDFVQFLRAHLDQHRYFRIIGGEAWAYMDKKDPSEDYQAFKKIVYDTYKQKLFGINNGIFHLAAASGDYESLFPRRSQNLIEFLKRADKSKLDLYLPWADVRFWCERRLVEKIPLEDEGEHLWRVYKTPEETSDAYWLPSASAARLDAPFASISASPRTMGAVPWNFFWPREDRLEVQGRASQAGILYLAQPFYPGWEAYVNGKRAALRPAWQTFTALYVPAGAIQALLIYRPTPWRWGVWISLIALAGLTMAAYAKAADIKL